jgi:hypothetical protein
MPPAHKKIRTPKQVFIAKLLLKRPKLENKEIVAIGKAEGISVSDGLVYFVRQYLAEGKTIAESPAKAPAKKASAPAKKAPALAKKAPAKPRRAAAPSPPPPRSPRPKTRSRARDPQRAASQPLPPPLPPPAPPPRRRRVPEQTLAPALAPHEAYAAVTHATQSELPPIEQVREALKVVVAEGMIPEHEAQVFLWNYQG